MSPSEGHLKAVKRIFSYLKAFPKGMIIIDTSYLDHPVFHIEDHQSGKDIYAEEEEEIPSALCHQ